MAEDIVRQLPEKKQQVIDPKLIYQDEQLQKKYGDAYVAKHHGEEYVNREFESKYKKAKSRLTDREQVLEGEEKVIWKDPEPQLLEQWAKQHNEQYGKDQATPTDHGDIGVWRETRDQEFYDRDQILGKFFRLKHFVANDAWQMYSDLPSDQVSDKRWFKARQKVVQDVIDEVNGDIPNHPEDHLEPLTQSNEK